MNDSKHKKYKAAWDACLSAGIQPPHEIESYLEQKHAEQNAPDEGHQPVAYGYGRVSTGKQAKEGWSLEDQGNRIKKYYELYLQDQDVIWGDIHSDPAVSAYKNFYDRKAGAALGKKLRKGDHVIMTSYSRGFRSFRDAVNVFERWIVTGIHLHLLDMRLDTSTIWGRTFLRMMAVMSAAERELIAERTRLAIAYRTSVLGAQGKQVATNPPFGFRCVGKKKHRRLVPDPEQRKMFAVIVQMRDEENLTWYEIFVAFRKAKFKTRSGKPWYLQGLKDAYKAELKLRDKEKEEQNGHTNGETNGHAGKVHPEGQEGSGGAGPDEVGPVV